MNRQGFVGLDIEPALREYQRRRHTARNLGRVLIASLLFGAAVWAGAATELPHGEDRGVITSRAAVSGEVPR